MRQLMRTLIKSLLIVALGMVVTATAGSPTISDLQGRWKLVAASSQPLPPEAADAVPAFAIADQVITGFDGCNRFSGRLDQPGSVVSTRRGCLEGRVKLPLDLADPLSHLTAGQIDNGRLLLPARAGIPAGEFERIRN